MATAKNLPGSIKFLEQQLAVFEKADFGPTFWFDLTFKRAYDEGVAKGMVPKWFQNSVQFNRD